MKIRIRETVALKRTRVSTLLAKKLDRTFMIWSKPENNSLWFTLLAWKAYLWIYQCKIKNKISIYYIEKK